MPPRVRQSIRSFRRSLSLAQLATCGAITLWLAVAGIAGANPPSPIWFVLASIGLADAVHALHRVGRGGYAG